MSSLQAVRGMRDLLPASVWVWQHLEQTLERFFLQYGYQEIRLPLLERTEVFRRGIGDITDIVEKEMYTFEDRSGERLSLRPEGTAGCVRAALEHGLLYHQTQKWWNYGPMFRYERPQRGRYRQFYQCSLECFGFPGPDIEVELLVLSYRLWQALGLNEEVHLKINSLGEASARKAYREHLVRYFEAHQAALDPDSLRRLSSNPLRILDSKQEAMAELLANAPSLLDHLDHESQVHFEQLLRLLDHLEIPYTVDPRLVRGLDYYSKTVFEWVTSHLGAQGTVCAGGRYDSLVPLLGGKACPAVGMAFGMDRIVELLEDQIRVPTLVDAYLIVADGFTAQAFVFSERLRAACPWLRLLQHLGEGSIKNQFKRADKSQALIALVLGETEVRQEQITIKWLREDQPQETIMQTALALYLERTLRNSAWRN